MSTHPVIAIVGATGAVGQEMLSILALRRFAFSELRLLASSRSVGKSMMCGDQSFEVSELTADAFDGCDIALFSAGASISREFAPLAVERGCTVIDNSSAFRMHDDVPLVIPEINEDVLDDMDGPGIIAVPNCSTIIALMAVTPLYDAVGIERMVVSTYQAISGAGAAAMAELQQQARDFAADKPLQSPVLGKQCLFNVFSHNSAMGDDGYNMEETKLVKETHKIWGDDSVGITATCVRVPVLRAHSESINLTFRKPLSENEAREILRAAPGVKLVDDRAGNKFPEPLDASGNDAVLVGRIRADYSQPPHMGLNLFVCGDQLRKGAALDAVQIAECVMERREVASVG